MVTNGKNGVPTSHYKKRFLEHYVNFCVINKAAEAAGVTRRTVQTWRENDKEFLSLFESAQKDIVEKLEHEAIRRAYAGFDKGVWHKGKRVGVEREYSDVLLIFLLKGNAPMKYRERVEHSGEGGGPLPTPTFIFQMPDGKQLTAQELKEHGNSDQT